MQLGRRSISVVALRDFEFDSRLIHRGEAVEMPPLAAAVEGRKGHVSLDPMRRATYIRCDLVAQEPQPVLVQVVQPEPEPEPVDPPKRRRGRPRKKPITE